MAKKSATPLLFVDTNILLDFYRASDGTGLKLLERLNKLHDQVITTYQVEAEFLRNRQDVILDYTRSLKDCVRGVTAPAFVAETKTNKILSALLRQTKAQVANLERKLLQAIENPKKDPVLRITQRLFASSSSLNLQRSDDLRTEIKQRAQSRFSLGYPPRKSKDTSIGDAFNWEWILKCIEMQNRDVVIVSRDGDYGCFIKDVGYPNDWLQHEVKDRVNRRRSIHLVNRLSAGLKRLEVKVTEKETKEEEQIVTSSANNANIAQNVYLNPFKYTGLFGANTSPQVTFNWDKLVDSHFGTPQHLDFSKLVQPWPTVPPVVSGASATSPQNQSPSS